MASFSFALQTIQSSAILLQIPIHKLSTSGHLISDFLIGARIVNFFNFCFCSLNPVAFLGNVFRSDTDNNKAKIPNLLHHSFSLNSAIRLLGCHIHGIVILRYTLLSNILHNYQKGEARICKYFVKIKTKPAI